MNCFRIGSIIAGLFCFASLVYAHAILLTSNPATGALVRGPDLQIILRFNSRLDAKRSRLVLVPKGGDQGTLAIGEQSSPDTLNSQVQGLKSGSYVLRWQVLAVDGHISRGEVPFTVQ